MPGTVTSSAFGSSCGHPLGRLGGKQVAGLAADDQSPAGRRAPSINGQGSNRGVPLSSQRLGDRHVIVGLDAAVRPFAGRGGARSAPIRRRVVREGIAVRCGQRFGRFLPAGQCRALADIGRAMPLEPGLLDVGADVVEHGAGDPLRRRSAQQHGHQPAERGADEHRVGDRRARRAASGYPRHRSAARSWRDWGRTRSRRGRAARRDHPPFAGQPVGNRLEIARVAGQAGHAEDRRAVVRAGIVAIMQPQAVAARPIAIGPRRPSTLSPCSSPPLSRPMASAATRRIAPIRRSSSSATTSTIAVEPARFPAGDPALPQRPLGGAGRARRSRRRRTGRGISAASSRCPDNLPAAAGAALSRPPVPRVQSRHRRRPRLPVRPAARRRAAGCSTSAPRARARRPTAASATAG